MELKYTKDLIYKNCADRIAAKQTEKGLSNRNIYPNESKIIGRIKNCDIRKDRNPYLIQDSVLNKIVSKLDFGSPQDVLWGTQEEINYYLPVLFQHIVFDMLSTASEYKDKINEILCRYVPYARYLAYHHLLFECKSPIPEIELSFLYDINDIEAKLCIDTKIDEAIAHLFSLCRKDFMKIYLEFVNEISSFKKWDNKLLKWIDKDFFPMLQPYAPTANSIGVRIKTLLSCDYSYLSNILFSKENNNADKEAMKKLITATDDYILKLEEIQAKCANKNLFR